MLLPISPVSKSFVILGSYVLNPHKTLSLRDCTLQYAYARKHILAYMESDNMLALRHVDYIEFVTPAKALAKLDKVGNPPPALKLQPPFHPRRSICRFVPE